MKTLLLLGGGHAHVEVLRAFAQAPIDGWKVVLVSPFPRQLYSGMVPGVVAGHYALDECAIDLQALCRRANVSLQRNRASFIDPARREVVLADGGGATYDLMSLNIGGRTLTGNARGVDPNAVVIRPLEEAMRGWSNVLDRARKGAIRSVTLVGAGAAGIELALAVDHRLKQETSSRAPHVRVIGDVSPLAGIPGSARDRLLRLARENGIGLHTGSAVTEVGADFVQLDGGLQFASDATIWTTGTQAPDLVRDSGFATDARGYLLTNDFLQSVSHPQVFAVGDCATQRDRDRPRAGVFAVRAAPALAANLRAVMTGSALRPDRKSTRLNSSHIQKSRMPSSA